jgi:hypothetical protein
MIAGISAAQRRAASRSGVLTIVVRANATGVVTAVAKGRIGKRVRRLASTTARVAKGKRAKLHLHLSRPARLQLRAGKPLRLTVRVTSPGAIERLMHVRLLPGGRS